MYDVTLIQTLGIVIVTAAAALLLGRLVQAPGIVAFLLAGVLLGPVLHLLPQHETGNAGPDALHTIGELGIVLLLFLVGLELSLDKVKAVGKVAVAAGLGQVVFTAAGGVALAWLLGFTLVESIFIATALTFSSTVVVVKVLDQKGDLNSLYGRIAVGIFLVQDLVVIAVLTVLTGLERGAEETVSAGDVALGIGQAFAGTMLLLGLSLVSSRWLLPRPAAWIAPSPRTLVIWSLCWCLLLVELAHLIGLSREIGAFLAGLSLGQLSASHDLRRRVHPLMNFFVAVLFVTLGAQMQFEAAAAHWKAGIVLSLFVLIGNPFIFLWIIARFGYGERTCFFTSVTVAQISEFSFIFAAMGVTAGLIDESVLSLIAVVGLLTIIGSVYMILYSDMLYRWSRKAGLLKMFRAGQHDDAAEEAALDEQFRGHIVVVGMNALGQSIARALHELGQTVVAIDSDPKKLASLPCATVVGDVDYRSVLDVANVASARLAITALKIEDVNRLFVYRCKQMGVPVAAHVFDKTVREGLEQLEPTYLLDSKAATDRALERELLRLGVATP